MPRCQSGHTLVNSGYCEYCRCAVSFQLRLPAKAHIIKVEPKLLVDLTPRFIKQLPYQPTNIMPSKSLHSCFEGPNIVIFRRENLYRGQQCHSEIPSCLSDQQTSAVNAQAALLTSRLPFPANPMMTNCRTALYILSIQKKSQIWTSSCTNINKAGLHSASSIALLYICAKPRTLPSKICICSNGDGPNRDND